MPEKGNLTNYSGIEPEELMDLSVAAGISRFKGSDCDDAGSDGSHARFYLRTKNSSRPKISDGSAVFVTHSEDVLVADYGGVSFLPYFLILICPLFLIPVLFLEMGRKKLVHSEDYWEDFVLFDSEGRPYLDISDQDYVADSSAVPRCRSYKKVWEEWDIYIIPESWKIKKEDLKLNNA